MVVAISRAFDVEAIDKLLFLHKIPEDYLAVSGDGVLQFARLIAADLACFEMKANNAWLLVTYTVKLTLKGKQMIAAWKEGDRKALSDVLSTPAPDIAALLREPPIVVAEMDGIHDSEA